WQESLESLREKLLKVPGIGEETADSILLYAGSKPIFVIDTYTMRVVKRHQLVKEKDNYGELQRLFMKNLPRNTEIYNEYHALLVHLGKEFCGKRKPLCKQCPLRGYLDSLREDL
ncbi:MAG: endonuclease III domain-containing protein, partial [Acidobacteriota bacterium]